MKQPGHDGPGILDRYATCAQKRTQSTCVLAVQCLLVLGSAGNNFVDYGLFESES